jgi:hypothetical protein
MAQTNSDGCCTDNAITQDVRPIWRRAYKNQMKCSRDIEWTSRGLRTDIPTDRCKAICPSSSKEKNAHFNFDMDIWSAIVIYFTSPGQIFQLKTECMVTLKFYRRMC